MDDTELQARKRLLDAAKAYHGTPYHHRAMLKGVGVDCGTFLICAATDAGLVPPIEVPVYSEQFNLHRSEDWYWQILMKHCVEVPMPPLPGDFVIWQFGRCFSHAALVIDWPRVLHACIRDRVRYDDAHAAQWLRFVGESAPGNKPRPMKLASFWGR